MAKKKKLNKNVILVLALVGAMVLGVGALLGYRYRHQIFRKDPAVCLQKGKAAMEKGDYANAEGQAGLAVLNAPKTAQGANYYYEYAKIVLEIVEKRTDLNTAQRRSLFTKAYGALNKTVVQDPSHRDAQKLLANYNWSIAQASGNWMLFINDADKLIKLDPNDHATWFRRGVAWMMMAKAVPGQNTDNAIRDLQKTVELKGDELDYRLTYANFLRDEERWDAAQKVYEAGIVALPDNPNLRIEYGTMLSRRNRPADAVKQIQEAVKRAPNSPEGYFALTDYYTREKKYDIALETLDKAQKLDDSEPRMYAIRSRIHFVQKHPAEAIQDLRDGLNVLEKRIAATSNPASAPSSADETRRSRLTDNRKVLQRILATTLLDYATLEESKKSEFLSETKKLLEITGGPSTEIPIQAQIAGRIAYIEGNSDQAIKYLEPAFSAGGDAVTAFALVNLYLRQQLPGKAEAVVDRLRRNPLYANDAQTLAIKAMLEMHYRNLDQAQRYLDQGMRADPNNAMVLNIQNTLRAMRGDVSVAQIVGKSGLNQASLAMLMNRTTELWESDRRPDAIALLEDIQTQAPDNAAVAIRLIAFYADVNNIVKAKAMIDKIRAGHPDLKPSLDLQEKLLGEKDTKKRQEIELALTDQITDPLAKALRKADICQKAEDQANWLKYIQEAEKISADNPNVVRQYFTYALVKKDWKLADEYAQKAAKLNIDECGGKLFAAQMAMTRQQYPQAVAALTEVIKEKPNIKTPYVVLGQCYLEMKDLPKARDAFETLAKNDPANSNALIGMAMVSERQGKMLEYAEWVAKAYRMAPSHPYVQKAYVQLQEEKARPDEIIVQREKMLRQNPEDLDNCRRLAMLYEKVKATEKAEELYRYVREKSSDQLADTGLLAEFYARIGRVSDGERLLVPFLQSWPDKIGAYIRYANYLLSSSPSQARAAVQKAIELDPKDPRGYFSLSLLEASQGNWAAAAEAKKKYLEIKPDETARRDYVSFCIEGRLFPQAEQELAAMLAANPSDTEAITLKAKLALKQGNVDKAIETLNKALQANADNPQILLTQASIFLTQGDQVKAKMALLKARAVSKHPAIAMELARIQMQMGDNEGAQAVLREILDKPETADHAPAMSMLAQIYREQKRWPKLAELLSEAKAKFPKNPFFLQMEADMYRSNGNPSQAAAVLEEALKGSPDSSELLREYLLSLIEAGNYNKAIATVEEYQGKPAYGLQAAALRARVLAKLGRKTEADKQFLTATKGARVSDVLFLAQQMQATVGIPSAAAKVTEWINRDPNNAFFYVLVGYFHSQNKDSTKASEAYAKAAAIALDAGDKAVINRELGLCYYELKKFKQAEAAYLESLKTIPDDPMTLNNLAYMYVSDLNEPAKALPHSRKAAQLAPNNPDILDTYGWALAKTDKFVDAEAQLLRAVQLSDSPLAATLPRYHLGWVQEQTQRFSEALRQYRQVADILKGQSDNPLNAEVSQAMTRAQQKQAK